MSLKTVVITSYERHDDKGLFKKLPMPSKEELKRLYLKENKTPYRIGEIFKVSSNTVRRWLKTCEIPIKRPYISLVKTELSETQKAYLAGYLDGDGTITAGFFKNKKSRRGLNPMKEVSLISIHKNFILKLQRMIGGEVKTFIYEDTRSKKEGYKLVFSNQASALAFLKAIVPYLILKQQQAELMIRYLTTRLEKRAIKGNSAPISDESLLLLTEIRRLNKWRKNND